MSGRRPESGSRSLFSAQNILRAVARIQKGFIISSVYLSGSVILLLFLSLNTWCTLQGIFKGFEINFYHSIDLISDFKITANLVKINF